MPNCQYCHKELVRHLLPSGEMENVSTLKRRKACHDNQECKDWVREKLRERARIRKAVRSFVRPCIVERFYRGMM